MSYTLKTVKDYLEEYGDGAVPSYAKRKSQKPNARVKLWLSRDDGREDHVWVKVITRRSSPSPSYRGKVLYDPHNRIVKRGHMITFNPNNITQIDE